MITHTPELHIEIDCQPMILYIWDGSANWADYECPRSLGYHNTDGYIICFSIDTPESLDNVTERWMPEVEHFMAPDAPVFLVGCKHDLRKVGVGSSSQAAGQNLVSHERGTAVAESIKARLYLECSTTTGEGVHEVLLHVSKAVKSHKFPTSSRNKNGCIIA